MSPSLRTLMPLAAVLAAGCVTINIYFPASAAEKAADSIIDEVWQIKGKPAPKPPVAPAPSDAPKEKTP
jgi:uncharacterized protein